MLTISRACASTFFAFVVLFCSLVSAQSLPDLSDDLALIVESEADSIIDIYSTPTEVAEPSNGRRPTLVSTTTASNVASNTSVANDARPFVSNNTNTVTRPCFGGDVWEISTRRLSCWSCASVSADQINFEVYKSCSPSPGTYSGWQRSHLEEATSATRAVDVSGQMVDTRPLTIIYVHGNWMERDNARDRVRIIDRAISRRATEPYRLIMLSWPSQRNEPLLKDIRNNAKCAEGQAYYLACLLDKLRANSHRVSLMGFSLGAITVTGALHLDAGGTIAGLPMPTRTHLVECNSVSSGAGSLSPVHTAYRVSLIAPAVDREWIKPRGKFNLAIGQIDRLVNLYNSKDPILRRFRMIDTISRPIAAGFQGFESIANARSTRPFDQQTQTCSGAFIAQYDCGSQIGGQHAEKSYLSECPYYNRAIDNVLGR